MSILFNKPWKGFQLFQNSYKQQIQSLALLQVLGILEQAKVSIKDMTENQLPFITFEFIYKIIPNQKPYYHAPMEVSHYYDITGLETW